MYFGSRSAVNQPTDISPAIRLLKKLEQMRIKRAGGIPEVIPEFLQRSRNVENEVSNVEAVDDELPDLIDRFAKEEDKDKDKAVDDELPDLIDRFAKEEDKDKDKAVDDELPDLIYRFAKEEEDDELSFSEMPPLVDIQGGTQESTSQASYESVPSVTKHVTPPVSKATLSRYGFPQLLSRKKAEEL